MGDKIAIMREREDNWICAYDTVAEAIVLKNANVICLHFIFKVNDSDHGGLKVKGLIVLHGHWDADKDNARKDCAAADMLLVRMA